MMHFIFILRVDLVGNWLLYSISEEMSSNLTRFLNLFDKFFSGLTRIEPMHKLYMHHGVALRGGRANRSAKLGWQKERAGLQGLTANP